jgi:hypothetical protein
MTVLKSAYRRQSDHFEPQDSDPQEQRRIRALLEQIDYTAYVSNREVLGRILGPVSADAFQKLAVAVAAARAEWTAQALALATTPAPDNPDPIRRLAAARQAFEELAEAYEALRRMVERGYIQPT